LVGGYAIASLVSIVMMFNLRAVPIMIVVFVGSGVYMGIQEAIERAMAADLLPQSSRSFGFGVLASINGVADFVSSLAVGALWDLRGPTSAFAYSAVFTAVGALALAALIPAKTMTKTDQSTLRD
jgi:MFS family permease